MNEINLPIDVVIMSFIKQQSAETKLEKRRHAGVRNDHAYMQLVDNEVRKTEAAIKRILDSHAGPRRLAAILSIAAKAAAREV